MKVRFPGCFEWNSFSVNLGNWSKTNDPKMSVCTLSPTHTQSDSLNNKKETHSWFSCIFCVSALYF